MERFSFFLTLMLLSAAAQAEVVRKITVNDDSGVTAVYYNDNVECAREVFDKNSNLMDRQGSIPDGVVKQYSSNGKLAVEYNYKDGRKEGLVKKYSENGKIKQEMSYRAGRRNGPTRDYFNNGILKQDSLYENGKLNGLTKVYLSGGSLFAEISFVNDVREGPGTVYFESGRPGEVSNYKAGKKDGIAKVYFDSEPQRLQFVHTYRDGELIKSVEYNPDGTPKVVPAR
jgi:antitoxin component YwqK of YwqJK toxin-antitoxin module